MGFDYSKAEAMIFCLLSSLVNILTMKLVRKTQVETSFDRVSDIIQYINYWQDQYLDLRRQKRHLEDEIDEDKFNEHLKKMREVSSEVGEFLRLLRTMDYITIEEFQYNDYEALFGFTGDLNAWDEFRKNRPTVEVSTPPAASVEPEEPVEGEPALEEEPDIDLGSIPGIDLLEEKEDLIDEVEETVEAVVPDTSDSEEELIGDASDLYQEYPEEVNMGESVLEEAEEAGARIDVLSSEEQESNTIEFDLGKEQAEEPEAEDSNVDELFEEEPEPETEEEELLVEEEEQL